jgi:hypothetical protein
MPNRTIHEHVQAVREGRDYKSPLLAINDTIEGLVHCGLIVRDHETNLTPEVRALDAIGVQVERELNNRKMMILALVDRVNTLQAVVDLAREAGYNYDPPDMGMQAELQPSGSVAIMRVTNPA